jgi:uncharacterized protein (TIGR02118 family)
MIKVSVLYPNNTDAKFDSNYYCDSHIPMVRERLGNACNSVAVEIGVCGIVQGVSAIYIAMGHLYFDSLEKFHESFGPHAEEIMGDAPNYTNVEPVVQISEVKI